MKMIAERYEIKKLIGQGGMADVYLAYDIILSRSVAVKVLRSDMASDPSNLARFQKEAMALANTSHPNIVDVYDVGSEGSCYYIVMEYVEGKTLKQLIAQRGRIPLDESVNIMKQLVSAVSHAHKMGIIHRDIKSQNILVKPDGTVKLSDFGIAYIDDSLGLTKKETVMGSVHYIAPELAKGSKPSAQSDIYALGIVFYELLTCDVPFHGDTMMEIIMKHLHDEIPSVRSIDINIPQSVENIIIKATAKDPSKRYQSAMDMYNDICTCLDLARNYDDKIDLNASNSKEKNVVKVVKRKKKKSFDFLNVLYGLALAIVVILVLWLLITLNKGSVIEQEKVSIPNVTSYLLADGKALLESNGFEIGNIEYEANNEIEKGCIISTSPSANSQVYKNSQVSLLVSLGARFTVENYVGKNIDEVKPLLESAGFVVNVTTVESDSAAYGTILSQNISVGTVIEPTEQKVIYFNVATYKSFLIPVDIINMDINDAKTLLENLGGKVKLSQLKIEDNLDEDGNYIYKLNTVVSISPEANTYYLQTDDSYITLYYY